MTIIISIAAITTTTANTVALTTVVVALRSITLAGHATILKRQKATNVIVTNEEAATEVADKGTNVALTTVVTGM